MSAMVRSALAYAGRGWSVMPCGVDKRPLVAWGSRQRERADADQVRDWWRTWPDANVAVVTGAVSGIVVLDIDHKPGGADGAETLRDAGLDVPATRAVRTPSGGTHAYFRHPGGDLRNWQKRADLPGVDARGDGGYVLAPPSRTADGDYAAVPQTRFLPFADPPDWLVAGMRGGHRAEKPSVSRPDGWAALWDATCTPGDRHPTLIRLVGHWREHGLGEAESAALAVVWNAKCCSPPKTDDEIRQTVADLFRRYARAEPEPRRREVASGRAEFWWAGGGPQ